MGALKGKTTRTKPIPVTSNLIELPDELVRINEDVILSIDGMKVNSLKNLTSISHEIYYRIAQYVKDALAAEYKEKLDEIKALYNRGGFMITNIHCDNKFHKKMDSFAPKYDPPIKVNFVSAKEHAP
eukprot:10806800-Ditylum_brightwellii.AAC.1